MSLKRFWSGPGQDLKDRVTLLPVTLPAIARESFMKHSVPAHRAADVTLSAGQEERVPSDDDIGWPKR